MQKKRKVSKSKRRLMVFGIPALIIIIYFCITFISVIYEYSNLKKDEKLLSQQLIETQTKKKYYKTELKKLSYDEYKARYAKEKFLFSNNGEYVFKFPEEEKLNNIKEEEQNSYLIYGALGAIALVLCLAFLKKNKSKV